MRSLACILLLSLPGASALADTCVYVSVAGDKKIAVYGLDPKQGKLTHRSDTALNGEPGALTVDPARRFLFAALRSTGELASFKIDPLTGKLTHINTVPAGADPAHISTDHTGRYLLTAYYVANKVTVHAVGKDGKLSERPLQSFTTAEKAHAIVLDPSNRFAFVAHTGPNVITQLTWRPGNEPLSGIGMFSTGAGTGPRHLVFHPSKPIAYFSNEQGGSTTAYKLNTEHGTLAPLQTLSTLPKDFKGTNACAEIRMHPTGKFLYVSNRGHDSIACFALDATDGKMSSSARVPTEKTPRSFDIDPSGKFLFAAGESTGKVAAYRIDQQTGNLKPLETYDMGKQPWWVMAVDLPSDAALRKAVTFYVSFDESVKGDFGGGDLTLSTRSNHKTEAGKFVYEKGFDSKVFRIAKGKGMHGGALEVVDVLPDNGRIFFPAKGNLAYKPLGWGGSLSFWMNTDPDKLLKTKFCDPVQITQRGANDGGLWVDFNDASPRDMRLGIFPAVAPGQKPISESDPVAPMVRMKGIGFKAGEWHHIVVTWEGLDTGNKDARARLYIDGELRGTLKDIALAMKWELDKTGIYVAVNFIGLLDELALFDRPLTAAEVDRLHRQPGLLAGLKKG